VTRRSSPRRATGALRALREEARPATPLAAAQAVWATAVGPAIAASAMPVAERDGALTVACATSAWAEELDLMQSEIVSLLNRELGSGSDSGGFAVERLRVRCDPAHFST
jgi:predicted nucleic acid-binding Zn ribbon protein